MVIRPDHVAAYVRWSTDDQSTGTTLEVQRTSCEHYARSQGWTWQEDMVFIDDGYSGGDLQRPGMHRLRELVRRGEVDCVVVYRIDRLSRNVVDAVDLVLREWSGRCHLKSVMEPIDTTTDLGRVIFNVLATFADFERATIRHRLHTAKTKLIREGKQLHGRPAYGYRPHPSDKGRWVEDPDEAPLVRRVFDMLAHGESAYRVVQTLNQEGFRTRRGSIWSAPSLLWVARNPIYAGRAVYGKTSVVPADEVRSDQRRQYWENRVADKVRVTNANPKYDGSTSAAPALVDQTTWTAAQDTINGNRVRRSEMGSRALGSPHLLVGLAVCRVCGGTMVYQRAKTTPGYYICSHSRDGTCQDSGFVPADEADAIVEQEFLRLFGVREIRAERLKPRWQNVETQLGALAAATSSAQRDAVRAEDEDRRLLQATLAGSVPFDQLADLRAASAKAKADALARLEILQEERGKLQIHRDALQATEQLLSAADEWTTLPVWRKRQALQAALTGRIQLYRPHRGSGEPRQVTIHVPWAFA